MFLTLPTMEYLIFYLVDQPWVLLSYVLLRFPLCIRTRMDHPLSLWKRTHLTKIQRITRSPSIRNWIRKVLTITTKMHRMQTLRSCLSSKRNNNLELAPSRRLKKNNSLRHRHDKMHLLRLLPRRLPRGRNSLRPQLLKRNNKSLITILQQRTSLGKRWQMVTPIGKKHRIPDKKLLMPWSDDRWDDNYSIMKHTTTQFDFAAKPKVTAVKAKYREDVRMDGVSLMNDPRVVRGNTYAAIVETKNDIQPPPRKTKERQPQRR